MDSDGEGNSDVSVQFCAQPDGFVDNMTDCDDTSSEDLDGDGFAGGAFVTSCNQPNNSDTVNSDCNDGDGNINPDADEVCDGVDDD